MVEEFRDVKGYEGLYQVSNMGRVKSLERMVKHWRGGYSRLKERMLNPGLDSDGYRKIDLYKDGKPTTKKIAPLVAIAFLGHTPNGGADVVDHISGVKSDDKVNNLRVVSRRENSTTCHRKDRDNLTSQYPGVHWGKLKNKWVAQISIKGKQENLGFFDVEYDAYIAYENAKIKYKII